MHNIAIVGYGNLGRGVELSLANNSDLNLKFLVWMIY